MSGVSRESYSWWVKEEVIPDVLDEDQVNSLRSFIEEKISLGSSYCDIGTDKTAWDSNGVIEKLWQTLDTSIRERFTVDRGLKIGKVFVLKMTERDYYYERYWELQEDSTVKYSAIATLSNGYGGGESVYFRERKSTPTVGNVTIHRHEKLNSWAVNTITSGARLDIILTLEELEKD